MIIHNYSCIPIFWNLFTRQWFCILKTTHIEKQRNSDHRCHLRLQVPPAPPLFFRNFSFHFILNVNLIQDLILLVSSETLLVFSISFVLYWKWVVIKKEGIVCFFFFFFLWCSGKKPDYLGVQKNPPALALCPVTRNCVSTSENISDRTHYAPLW